MLRAPTSATSPTWSSRASYRELSSATVLTMEFLDGFKPGSPADAARSRPAERARLIDLGAAAIIRMLYQDGFFHADLHAGNLLVLPGEPPARVGFIDLGMVGRFEEATRGRMLYYYHALVDGRRRGRGAASWPTWPPWGAAATPQGFRRAVVDLSRRFVMRAARGALQHRPAHPGVGGARRPLPRLLPGGDDADGEGAGHLRGRGPHARPAARRARASRSGTSRASSSDHFSPRDAARASCCAAPPSCSTSPCSSRSCWRTGSQLPGGGAEPPRRRATRSQGVRSGILAAACIVGGVVALVSAGPAAALGRPLRARARCLAACGGGRRRLRSTAPRAGRAAPAARRSQRPAPASASRGSAAAASGPCAGPRRRGARRAGPRSTSAAQPQSPCRASDRPEPLRLAPQEARGWTGSRARTRRGGWRS